MNRSPRDADRPWLGLGKILPRRTRLRIFEPYYWDLLSERREGRSPGAFRVRVALGVLDAARVGFGVWLGRLGRAARVGLLLAVAAIVLLLMGRGYAPSDDSVPYGASSDPVSSPRG